MSTSPRNSFIGTEKSKPKRTIERKIASLIFLESHDVQGTLFVESLVCLGGRGKRKGGRNGERNGVEGEGGGLREPRERGGRDGGRKGRKRRRGQKERNLDSEYSSFPGWQNKRAQGGGKNCGKLTQSRIMAKSIKFDQLYYNEVSFIFQAGTMKTGVRL